MLFDLRGRGRRRTVQVIYLGLALLMGGGLVLFGVGGDVQGGLLDAFKENKGSANDAIEKRVESAEKKVKANPQQAAAYAQLAVLAYAANQSRKGDLASKKALELAPKDQRASLKASIEQAKTQALQQQAQGATT